jgi:hypothetical protein
MVIAFAPMTQAAVGQRALAPQQRRPRTLRLVVPGIRLTMTSDPTYRTRGEPDG